MSKKIPIKTDSDEKKYDKEEYDKEEIFYEDDNPDNPDNPDNKRLKVTKKPLIRGFKPSSTISPPIQNQILTNTTPQIIKVLSTFFTYTIVEQFNTLITNKPSNYVILNMDQFITFIQSKIPDPKFDNPYYIKLEILKLKNESMCSKTITEKSILGEEVSYLDGVGNKYLEEVLQRSTKLQPYEDYDIAFLVDTTLTSQSVEKYILAIIVAQRRECPKYENAYCLNLICSKERTNGGTILVGLYLYTILCHPIKTSYKAREEIKFPTDLSKDFFGTEILHKGLLEVSGGFTNTGGLCLYSKFGFVPNILLSGNSSNCFHLDSNIAMEKNFNPDNISQEKQNIIDIVNKVNPGYTKPKICFFTDVRIRKVLGILYNIKAIKERQLYKEKLLVSIKQDIIDGLNTKLELIKNSITKIEELNNDIDFEDVEFVKEIASKVSGYANYQSAGKIHYKNRRNKKNKRKKTNKKYKSKRRQTKRN